MSRHPEPFDSTPRDEDYGGSAFSRGGEERIVSTLALESSRKNQPAPPTLKRPKEKEPLRRKRRKMDPETSRIDAPIVLTDEEDAQSDASSSSQSGSDLKFRNSTLRIPDKSLDTLRPTQWLDDVIINTTLRIIEELSNSRVKVVDSLTVKARGKVSSRDFANAKVLLPLHIDDVHWILGVVSEDRCKVDLIDPLPSGSSKQVAMESIKFVYRQVLQMDDIWPQITVVSPLVQEGASDCGVIVIIAAFHISLGLQIGADADTGFWRDMLSVLLGPQQQQQQRTGAAIDSAEAIPPPEAQASPVGHPLSLLEQQIDLPSLPMRIASPESIEAIPSPDARANLDRHPLNLLEQQIDLPGLPMRTAPSEIPTLLSGLLCGLSVDLMSRCHETQRTLSTADSALTIVRHAQEAAANAGLLDILGRFKRAGEYCAVVLEECNRGVDALNSLASTVRFANNEIREGGRDLHGGGDIDEDRWVRVRHFANF